MPALDDDDDEDGGAAAARLGRDDRFPPDRDRQLLASLRTTPLIVPAPILTSCAGALQGARTRAATSAIYAIAPLNHARKNGQKLSQSFQLEEQAMTNEPGYIDLALTCTILQIAHYMLDN